MTLNNSSEILHADLIIGCRKGDRKAQMEIYRLYHKPLFNTCMRIVGDETEAEDVMQEAFLKAFNLLQKTELTASLGGWLRKIVINMAIDVVRKRKVFFEPVDEIRDVQIEETADSEWQETVSDKIRMIKEGMMKLPDKYRSILSLYLIEGYDHDEISGILKISASTSRAHLSRGKKKLLQLIIN